MKMPLKNYCCVRQHDIKDCAAACISTICSQYGLKLSIAKIRDMAGTDKQGTSVYGIIKAAEKLGFSAKAFKTENKEDILTNFPLPAIAHVMLENNMSHYVVIHEISKKKIIVADPAKGILNYELADFFKIWTGILVIMVPTVQFNKGDNTKSTFIRFIHLILPQKKVFINVFFASIIVSLLGVAGSFYFKIILDSILPSSSSSTLRQVSTIIIIISLFKVIIESVRTQLLLYLSQNIDISLMLGYYNHVINSPISFFSTREVGEVLSRFSDASKIREAVSGAAITIVLDSLMFILGGIILYNTSHTLFFITIIPIVLYIVIVLLFNKPIEKANRKIMEDNAQLNSYIVESLNGIETVKSLNSENKVSLETEKRFVKLVESVFKNGFINNIQTAIKDGIRSIFGIIILWVGTYEVMRGNISIGELLTFNALLIYFLDPIQRIVNLQSTIQSANVAADRLWEVMEMNLERDEDEEEKISPLTLQGNVEFKNVYFRYGTRILVLDDINMNILPGQKIALVGESGSGKTTIAKLIMNFYQCERGEILLNGYNIQDINLDVLRNKIAYISQEMFFFSGTIRDNLKLANSDVTFEEIIDACRKAQIHDFINSLPMRYDTLLEENGANLSGGQKQRLAIARAIIKKPDILIMDEATSNLDSITEKAIEDAIYKFSKNITTIIIAHRLSTIMKCDNIYVIKDGKIVEQGDHNTLINSEGEYNQLWRKQIVEKNIVESVGD